MRSTNSDLHSRCTQLQAEVTAAEQLLAQQQATQQATITEAAKAKQEADQRLKHELLRKDNAWQVGVLADIWTLSDYHTCLVTEMTACQGRTYACFDACLHGNILHARTLQVGLAWQTAATSTDGLGHMLWLLLVNR